jgi:hypothetical protein
MPRISEFYGIIIFMYFNDHYPPHFHARYNENEAIITISNSKVLKGKLPPRALKMVKEWAKLYREALLKNWHQIQNGESWEKLPPLE